VVSDFEKLGCLINVVVTVKEGERVIMQQRRISSLE
jgi:hypothetical protein